MIWYHIVLCSIVFQTNFCIFFLNFKEDSDNDENDTEGIQKKHRKQNAQDSLSSMSSDVASDDSEDEDFLGRKNTVRHKTVRIRVDDGGSEKIKRVYKATPGRPPRQRQTIKQLTESGILNRSDYKELSSDDEDDLADAVLKTRNKYDNDSDNDLNLSNFNKQYVNGKKRVHFEKNCNVKKSNRVFKSLNGAFFLCTKLKNLP